MASIAGVHKHGGKDEHLTPRHVLDALGPFDLDPCSPIKRPWDTAAKHYTIIDDGLTQPWHGRVWCNPPYDRETGKWLDRLAAHGHGIALIFARTDTVMFQRAYRQADSVLFLAGRLTFCKVDGKPHPANSGGPSVLLGYGETLELVDLPGILAK